MMESGKLEPKKLKVKSSLFQAAFKIQQDSNNNNNNKNNSKPNAPKEYGNTNKDVMDSTSQKNTKQNISLSEFIEPKRRNSLTVATLEDDSSTMKDNNEDNNDNNPTQLDGMSFYSAYGGSAVNSSFRKDCGGGREEEEEEGEMSTEKTKYPNSHSSPAHAFNEDKVDEDDHDHDDFSQHRTPMRGTKKMYQDPIGSSVTANTSMTEMETMDSASSCYTTGAAVSELDYKLQQMQTLLQQTMTNTTQRQAQLEDQVIQQNQLIQKLMKEAKENDTITPKMTPTRKSNIINNSNSSVSQDNDSSSVQSQKDMIVQFKEKKSPLRSTIEKYMPSIGQKILSTKSPSTSVNTEDSKPDQEGAGAGASTVENLVTENQKSVEKQEKRAPIPTAEMAQRLHSTLNNLLSQNHHHPSSSSISLASSGSFVTRIPTTNNNNNNISSKSPGGSTSPQRSTALFSNSRVQQILWKENLELRKKVSDLKLQLSSDDMMPREVVVSSATSESKEDTIAAAAAAATSTPTVPVPNRDEVVEQGSSQNSSKETRNPAEKTRESSEERVRKLRVSKMLWKENMNLYKVIDHLKVKVAKLENELIELSETHEQERQERERKQLEQEEERQRQQQEELQERQRQKQEEQRQKEREEEERQIGREERQRQREQEVKAQQHLEIETILKEDVIAAENETEKHKKLVDRLDKENKYLRKTMIKLKERIKILEQEKAKSMMERGVTDEALEHSKEEAKELEALLEEAMEMADAREARDKAKMEQLEKEAKLSQDLLVNKNQELQDQILKLQSQVSFLTNENRRVEQERDAIADNLRYLQRTYQEQNEMWEGNVL